MVILWPVLGVIDKMAGEKFGVGLNRYYGYLGR
jgi:hypothetical protein